MLMPTISVPKRLGDLLIERNVITEQQLQEALAIQKANCPDKLIGEVLIDNGFCTEVQVFESLAADFGIPFARLDQKMYDPSVADILPREYLEKNLVFPLFLIRGVLTIAVSEPSNLFLLDDLRAKTNKRIQIVATIDKDIRRLINSLPDSKVFVIDHIIDDKESETNEVTLIEEAIEDIGDLLEIADQSPIIRLVNFFIYSAVREGASDIHIEPNDRSVRIRNRVDGVLFKANEVPHHLHAAITSRIKVMAGLDISERRMPQDGRVNVMVDNRRIDLRVSTFPCSHGEKTVIRIFDNKGSSTSLGNLGFAEDLLEKFREQILQPNGIILVTGPTGSGKSTTLYAALNTISSVSKNICTVEDPVEFNLPLINQFQTNDKVGLTFSAALRTLLRQDPDVIMVGEIRDPETAKTAIQAALTGHLVLSTLHTNDAPSAVSRLLNTGVEPYLISAALNCVLAQRLVRKICPDCRQPYEPSRQIKRLLAKYDVSMDHFYRGVGCRRCRNTGHSGRMSLHELFVLTDEDREMIARGSTLQELRRHAQANGMKTLLYDGLRKAQEGMTTLEEVFQVTGTGAL